MAYDFNGTDQYLSANAPLTAMPATLSVLATADDSLNRTYVAVGETAGTHRLQLYRIQTGSLLGAAQIGSVGTTRQATTAWAAAGVAHSAVGTFESATSRAVFLDGSNKATNTDDAGSSNAYGTILIGARYTTSLGLYFDGKMSEAAVWSVVLSDAEIASLGKGFKPYRIRPQSLVFYAPLIRDLQDTRGGLAITNNNTATVANHPRVY